MSAILVVGPRAANHPFHGNPYLVAVCLGDPVFCIPYLCIPCLCIPCPGMGLCIPSLGKGLCRLYPCSLYPCARDSSHRSACTMDRSDIYGMSSHRGAYARDRSGIYGTGSHCGTYKRDRSGSSGTSNPCYYLGVLNHVDWDLS